LAHWKSSSRSFGYRFRALLASTLSMAHSSELVQNKVSTAEMCAATRRDESARKDALFTDPVAGFLARGQWPMGDWIMLPRTMRGDQLLREAYSQEGVRQVVLLGSGMDGRAWRMNEILGGPFSASSRAIDSPPRSDVSLFEVDFAHNFERKQWYLSGKAELSVAEQNGDNMQAKQLVPLQVSNYQMVGTDFQQEGRWAADLQDAGFDVAKPAVWLVEGLMMYLSEQQQRSLMQQVGHISAEGSVVFHDCISKALENQISVHGAPFIGGSDDYARLWREEGGFGNTFVRKIGSVWIDRASRTLGMEADELSRADPRKIAGKGETLLVEARKQKRSDAPTDRDL